jgi:hypothetical protein
MCHRTIRNLFYLGGTPEVSNFFEIISGRTVLDQLSRSLIGQNVDDAEFQASAHAGVHEER